ncbi:unnamed protein product [Echinostoma caproni]|uniref:Ubiquinone biosynthesis protein COQ4 homolog, mitochondrial n=1 Tax=Echinostoma caproni TaxID=27848 RepID=A0A183BBP9_9TREM|nr:unnamed protein product [Echinostoma caproni]
MTKCLLRLPSRSLSNKDQLNTIQLTPLQKVLLNVGSGIGVFFDPRRADLLSTFGEVTGAPALRYMRQKMLQDPHYSPDERHIVRFIEDPELAYVMQRYREIHDLVHTLLEQPTDMLGEVVVKWVEGLQNRLPMCITGGMFGSLRLAPKQTKNYLNNHLDYALRVGLHGHFLMNVYFEEHWADDMATFRTSLNIPAPPKRLPKNKFKQKKAGE